MLDEPRPRPIALINHARLHLLLDSPAGATPPEMVEQEDRVETGCGLRSLTVRDEGGIRCERFRGAYATAFGRRELEAEIARARALRDHAAKLVNDLKQLSAMMHGDAPPAEGAQDPAAPPHTRCDGAAPEHAGVVPQLPPEDSAIPLAALPASRLDAVELITRVASGEMAVVARFVLDDDGTVRLVPVRAGGGQLGRRIAAEGVVAAGHRRVTPDLGRPFLEALQGASGSEGWTASDILSLPPLRAFEEHDTTAPLVTVQLLRPHRRRVYRGRRARIRLGRGADVEGSLADVPTVSRRHAELLWHEGQLWVRDLGSMSGTFLNAGGVAGEPLPVTPGARLRLAQAKLRVDICTERDIPP